MGLGQVIFLGGILVTSASAGPLVKRAQDVVQNQLGSDGYWNDFDGGSNHYVQYTGNGSVAEGWPDELSWVSFNDLWTINQHTISRSCDILYQAPNNSEQEIQDLYDSIKQVAHETRVDHRVILAAVMQETQGCVRAKTSVSQDGIKNPGLLQSFKGSHSCNENGTVQNPCPKAQILGMIADGVGGTDQGQGYAADLNAQKDIPNIGYAGAYYRAARLYNSGAIDPSGNLSEGSATHCYASDIANRLAGWTDSQSTCTLDD